MKKILLIRHAKSSWADVSQKDFDRPLNDRGNKDAPRMAKRLLKNDVSIDAFVSSPAVRALTTAAYFAEAYGEKKKNIIRVDELYLAEPKNFFEIISGLDDKIKTVAIFSHNPGITEFANQLSNTRVDDMPTCAIFAVKAEIDSWKDLRPGENSFWFFDYPKNED